MTASSTQNPEIDQLARPTLSLVIVNYNSWDDVARQVAHLANSADLREGRVEAVIVDNASPQARPHSLSETLPPGVKLLLSPENGGFSAGVNLGWKAARGRWLLVLNPDVLTPAALPGQVLSRIAAYEARPEGPPGVVGFALADPDGTAQPSVGHDPGLSRLLRGLFLPRRLRKYQPVSEVALGEVPWVTGACMMVSTRVLEDLAGMDEDFFLYYEEVALCLRARQRGHRVEFDPAIRAVHCHPLQNRPLTPAMRLITRHSQLLYFQKYKGPMSFQTLARIIGFEASLRLWRSGGHEAEARANREIRQIARRMRNGELIRGPAIRDLAQSLTPPETRLDQKSEPQGSSRHPVTFPQSAEAP